MINIEKLLKDRKSGFYKFIKKNKGLKTLGRDYIEGSIEELYDFYKSDKDPEWDIRMSNLKNMKDKLTEGKAITNTKGPAKTPKPEVKPAPQKPKICTCMCHMEGYVIRHIRSCCDFTYKKYIDENGINMEKYNKLKNK
jgi:hypothetical protein